VAGVASTLPLAPEAAGREICRGAGGDAGVVTGGDEAVEDLPFASEATALFFAASEMRMLF
jgi:hypothetical protein